MVSKRTRNARVFSHHKLYLVDGHDLIDDEMKRWRSGTPRVTWGDRDSSKQQATRVRPLVKKIYVINGAALTAAKLAVMKGLLRSRRGRLFRSGTRHEE